MKKFSPTMALMPCFFGFVALFNNLGKDRRRSAWSGHRWPHGRRILLRVTFTILLIGTRKERNTAGDGSQLPTMHSPQHLC